MKQIKENAKTKMEKSINVMLSDFAGIRAGRANPSVLNKVQVCLLYTSPSPRDTR